MSDCTLSPLQLLIVQASPFCNIDCNYCYLPNRSSTARMTLDTVRRIGAFLSTATISADPLTVCWHAGEPLAVPIEFYEAAFTTLQANCTRATLKQNFQTNATLVDEEWCRFFKKWSVSVGVSVDGPQEIHDAHRIDRAGKGTFDRVMRGIKHLMKAEIPYSILCVATKDTLGQPERMWEFWESLDVSFVGINVEEVEGANLRSSLCQAADRDHARAFFAGLAKREAGSKKLRIRELDGMRRHLTAPPGTEVYRAVNRPGSIISIDVEGNISTFSPELLGFKDLRYGNFTWGNVHSDTWDTFPENQAFRKANSDIAAGVVKCKSSCKYFAMCGGGDPSNKLAETGTFDSTETQHCRLHVQAVADVVIEKVGGELGLDL